MNCRKFSEIDAKIYMNPVVLKKEIVMFDLRDACVNFLEEKGFFPPGRVPISMIIKIENFVSDLLHQAVSKARDIEMKGELGFGEP